MSERILVVDDEAVVLGAVTKALRKTDYKIDTAKSAFDALELLNKNPYDLVITDLMMPGLDGLEFIQRLHESGSPARIIVITGYPTIRTALRARQLGAFEYVTKPFTRQELVSVVVRALRHQAEPPPAISKESELESHCIPDHSWARMEPDGTARIGMTRAFAVAVGHVAELRFRAPDDPLEQGRMCAVIRGEDGNEHHLYSPLSGRLIEINPEVQEDPTLATRDPERSGWLLHISPSNPEAELKELRPEP
jgi:CheY-like chemotaxis protein/glycine cleavage system H lipoate-binding protein